MPVPILKFRKTRARNNYIIMTLETWDASHSTVCCFRASITECYLPFSHAFLILKGLVLRTIEGPTKRVLKVLNCSLCFIATAENWSRIHTRKLWSRTRDWNKSLFYIVNENMSKLFLIIHSANRYVALFLLHFFLADSFSFHKYIVWFAKSYRMSHNDNWNE